MDRNPGTSASPRPASARLPIAAVAAAAFALGLGFLAETPGLFAVTPPASPPNGTRLVGWNNLGMHCMDADFSVFSILPPYNTIDSQLIVGGQLIESSSGITVTYEAVPDGTGSINTTAVGKTNFWQYVLPLFGAPLVPDTGLAGTSMPGAANIPQPTAFNATFNSFHAEGIPITPYDDAGVKNYYPMMRLVARQNGTVIATTDIVLPVSDEMHCSACHSSGASAAAMPAGGLVFDPDPVRDYRLNILKLHDGKQAGKPLYATALAANGFNAAGLYANVVTDGKPILCASCHLSEALPGTGVPGVPALTQAVHAHHGAVTDPISGLTLNDSNLREACYRCHPGSTTKCLRGAMGGAVASDGSLSMQCQSCHGNMSKVGDPNRTGWLQEPNCQSCHTGTALQNNGQIRYTTVFEPNGTERVAVNATFATNPNTPAAGLSLYRFSKGHGGLQCSACHGSTHAEFPSTHANDNVASQQVQGHKGLLVECTSCHASTPNTVTGGPHGMHPVGQSFTNSHGDWVETNGSAQCRACHGTDYRGTVLSRSQADRTLSTKYGSKTLWRGFQVSCYTCHNGPNSGDPPTNSAPTVTNKNISTATDVAVGVSLAGTDPNGNALSYRIISQPAHGTVALSGSQATYFPEQGFAGVETFTFAAWDGFTQSNLGSVIVTVSKPPLPAGLVQYGSGNPGCAGPHDLRANSSPTIGNVQFALTCTQAPPVSLGLTLIGDAQDPGADPLGIGILTYVNFFTATELYALDAVSDANGYALTDVPIPASPALVGKHYFAQAIFVWTWPCSPSPFRLSGSNGLHITVLP